MAFEDVQFPADTSGRRGVLRVKICLGQVICWLAPGYANRVARGEMPARMGIWERAVVAALVHRHTRAGTLDQLAPLHAWLWKGEQAVSFHAQAQARFDNYWLHHHSVIVEPLKRFFDPSTSTPRYGTLCEIGCGSGLILEDIAKRLPEVPVLLGLDLSEQQTAINARRHVDERIRFVAGDANAWIPANGTAGTVYLTVAGVFEYFSRHSLQALFSHLSKRQAPAAVALIEPVPADYDFDREEASRPYGFENSMGHNYPRLLREAGFTIQFMERQTVDGQAFLLLVAATLP